MTQRFNFTQDTPHGQAEVELRRIDNDTYEATVLLPTGSELEVEARTSDFQSALDLVQDAVNFWAEDSENNEVPNINPPF